MEPRLPLIVDIDLDYFVEPIVTGKGCGPGRPSSKEYTVRDGAGVRELLERRCRLSSDSTVPGIVCEHHDEVYHHLDRLIEGGRLVPPFVFFHVDAHDDLGEYHGTSKVTPANFLMHCIRRDWIDRLVLLLPESERKGPIPYVKFDPPRIEFDSHRCRLNLIAEEQTDLRVAPHFLFLTRSPDFTPPTADPVYDLIRTYIQI